MLKSGFYPVSCIYNKAIVNERRQVVLVDSSANVFVEISGNTLEKYSFDPTVGDITLLESKSIVPSESILPKVASSADGNFFVPYTNGKVYNSSLEKVFEADDTSILAAVFSEETSSIFFVTRKFANEVYYIELKEYSTVTWQNSRTLRFDYSIVPNALSSLAVEGSTLILVFHAADFFGNTFTIKRIKL